MNGKISSINLSNSNACIILYEHKDCQGRNIRVVGSQQSLRWFEENGFHRNFDDMASSFKICPSYKEGMRIICNTNRGFQGQKTHDSSPLHVVDDQKTRV